MEYRQFLKYSETFLILSSYATCKRTTSHSITLIGFRKKKKEKHEKKRNTPSTFLVPEIKMSLAHHRKT